MLFEKGDRMSETSEPKEQYDSDDVFLQDEHSVEHDPRPLHLDAVFEEVRLWQAEYQDHVFTSYREASLYMKRVVEHFDLNVQSKDMIGRGVILNGTGIEIPQAAYNEITGRFVLEPASIDSLDSHISVGAAVHGLKGAFAGFGYKLQKSQQPKELDVESTIVAPDEGEEDTFKGRLYYQITTGGVAHAHGYTQFFITGNVLDSQVEFYDDLQKQKLDTILGKLLTVNSFATASQVNDLNVLLAEQDKLAEQLPEIVNLMGLVSQSKDFKDDIVKRDVLLDLFTHYINPLGKYSFTAPDAMRVVKGKRKACLYSDETPMIVQDQKINGIIMGKAYRRDEDKILTSRSRQVPYVVIEKSDQVLHVAMDRMTKFQVCE
jgi:hypothetical protein